MAALQSAGLWSWLRPAITMITRVVAHNLWLYLLLQEKEEKSRG
jgi:hypothetical protein